MGVNCQLRTIVKIGSGLSKYTEIEQDKIELKNSKKQRNTCPDIDSKNMHNY